MFKKKQKKSFISFLVTTSENLEQDAQLELQNIDTSLSSSKTNVASQVLKEISFEPVNPEFQQNFYKGRIRMNEKSHFMNSQTQFVFKDSFPITIEYPPYKAEDLKKTIQEDVEYFKKEPKYGLRPPAFNHEEYEKERKSFKYKHYVPSKFGPQKAQLTPLKRFELYTPRESVHTLEQLTKANPSRITLINLQNVNIYILTNVIRILSTLKRCEILVLRNVCLDDSIAGLRLPNLRVADFSYNQIKDPNSIVKVMKRSPVLEHIVLHNNPLTQNQLWKTMILANSNILKSIDNQVVTQQDVVDAVEKMGTPEQKKAINFMKWDSVICSILDNQRFTSKWDPTLIRVLCVRDAGLNEFHVGSFINLKSLDISHNNITTLVGAGLERLTKLRFFDFSYNKIADVECLNVLRWIPNLLEVNSEGNLFPGDYKPRIVYITINHPGLNRNPGLIKLDGQPVTLDQKVYAFKQIGADVNEIKLLRWKYCLIEHYGNHQIRKIPNYLQRVKILILPRQQLSHVDLSQFRRLEYIDLSFNNIEEIIGLEKMYKLKYLNLYGNTKLSNSTILGYLYKLENLLHLILPQPSEDEEERILAIASLLKTHTKLLALNNKLITDKERVAATVKIGELAGIEISKYRFNIAITMQTVKPKGRLYTPGKCKPGVQFKPKKITQLCLTDCQLDDSINFRGFVNLERLDISHNMITNIDEIGLSDCKKLKVFDFSHNKVALSMKKLAEFLDEFKELEIIAMTGNPCASKSNYRRSLMKKLKLMASLACKLQVIDYPISMQERMEIWKKIGLDGKNNEEQRFALVMKEREYTKDVANEIKEINLNECALRYANLKDYTNIHILLLRGNRFTSLRDIGVLDMRKLQCLDLRNNNLSNLDDIITIVNNCDNLESLAISGNKFGDYKYRLLSQVPKLNHPYCAFWELDAEEISTDDIVKTRKNAIEGEILRFQRNIFRKFVTSFPLNVALSEVKVDKSAFVELNLFGLNLTYVNFRGFENLSKLSLKNNKLKAKSIREAMFGDIPLQELDISYNEIEDDTCLIELMDTLPLLKTLIFEYNICYPKDEKPRRYSILARTQKCRETGWKLRNLNGKEITTAERCKALEKIHVLPFEIENIRVKLTLEDEGYTGEESKLILSSKQLACVRGLEKFVNVTTLDLSNNNIQFLDVNVITSLKFLVEIDLRDNQIQSVKSLLDVLKHSPSLQKAYLENAGKEFRNPQTYVDTFFETMRGMQQIDLIRNPYPLNEQQQKALEYLSKEYGLCPNNMLSISFVSQNVEVPQYWAIILALSTLVVQTKDRFVGPKSLKLLEGNFQNTFVNDYRYITTTHIPSLEELDDRHVSSSEKNAFEKISVQMKKEIAAANSELKSEFLTYNTVVQSATKNIKGLSANEVDFKFISENAGKIPIIGIYSNLLEFRTRKSTGLGDFFSKIELLIYFIQIFALLFACNLQWPSVWSYVGKILSVSNASVEIIWDDISESAQYLKFGIAVIIPILLLILFLVQFNKRRWEKMFIKYWYLTILLYLVVILAAAAGAFFLPFALVANSWNNFVLLITGGEGGGIEWELIIYWIIFGVIALLFAIVLFGNMFIFSMKRKDDEFWVKYFVKFRQRLSLFLLSILYIPVFRTIIVTYECNPKDPSVLRLFPSQKCLSGTSVSINDIPIIFYISTLFAIIYGAGIPILLAFLINRDWHAIEQEFNFAKEYKELAALKLAKKEAKDATEKAEKSQRIKEKKKLIVTKYVNSINDYNSAPSHLYAPFKKHLKYFLIFQVLVRIGVACVVSFMGQQQYYQAPTAAGILGFYVLIAILLRPYMDWTHNLVDISSHIVNIINILMGYALFLFKEFNWDIQQDFWSPLVLYIVNGVNLALWLIMIVVYPIRSFIKNRKALKQKASQMQHASSRFLNYKPPVYEFQQDKPKTIEEDEIEMNELKPEINSPRTESMVANSQTDVSTIVTEILENSALLSEEAAVNQQ